MGTSPLVELGKYLTAAEARGMAAMLESGQSMNKALNEINHARRSEAKGLVTAAGLSHHNVELSVAVLQGIAGAKDFQRELTPVWTMPGNEAGIGHLTNQFHKLVEGARVSVTAATYNFASTSKMWKVLREAAERPGVKVSVYVDGDKADAMAVKTQMPKASIYRSSKLPNGKQITSHAKFIIIDHSMMLITSANFSYSAENTNIEFGLRVDDPTLAESVEEQMFDKRGVLYELV
jgi:phosphatidylserine/phosphatidylglycerophosphate/cardiolipin synthase-like enzyme